VYFWRPTRGQGGTIKGFHLGVQVLDMLQAAATLTSAGRRENKK